MIDDHVTLETPEHIELHLELAGVGSRFLAAIIDSLLQIALILGIGLAAGAARWAITADVTRVWMGVVIALASSMLIIIGYYLGFELAWGGQSPGKRLAGLVVVCDDGRPIGFTEAAVRNILRLVDILPVLYTIGIVSILVTRSSKRIGDLAAGTLVIKVRDYAPRDPSGVVLAPQAYSVSPPAGPDPLVMRARSHVATLTPQEADTLTRFIERRVELEAASRHVVAARIAAGLRHRFPALSPQDVPDPEVFLEIIHQARALPRPRPLRDPSPPDAQTR